MGKLIFVLGGARSGKSTFALKLAAERGQKVLFIATAQAIDPEMKKRIEKHKAERPDTWSTLEIPGLLEPVLQGENLEAEFVVLDCLTLWMNNLMLLNGAEADQLNEDELRAVSERELSALQKVVSRGEADWIVVSNEVGLGLVPSTPIGRLYRDALGWVNQRVAQMADETYFMAAGVPIPLHRFRETGE